MEPVLTQPNFLPLSKMQPSDKSKKIVFYLLLGLFFLGTIILGRTWYSFSKRTGISGSLFYSLLTGKNQILKETGGKTNILLLGVPGGKHDGADLTDSMIFVSFNYSEKKITMVSIPRDLWLDSLKDKINSAFHYGEEKREGEGGFILSKASVEEVLGAPIHYAVLIDFAGIKDLIDVLGGVDVYVEKTFDDFKFPIEGKENDLCDNDPEYKCRYEQVHFDAGWQKMNGITALKFIRSRNAEGEEGGDLARSKRQQQVILALKKKLTSREVLFNPPLIRKFLGQLSKTVRSEIPSSLFLFLARFSLFVKEGNTSHYTLGEDFLTNPPLWQYDDRWVLAPKEGNFEKIHEWVKGIL